MKLCVIIVLIFAFVESATSEDDKNGISSAGTPSTVMPTTPKHRKTLFKIIFEFVLRRHFELKIGPEKPISTPGIATSTTLGTTTSHASSSTTAVTNTTTKTSTASPTINPTETPTGSGNATETVPSSTETANSSSSTGTAESSSTTETAESPNVTETANSSSVTEPPTEKSTSTKHFTTQHVAGNTTLYIINTTVSASSPLPQHSSGKLSSGDIAGIVIGVIAVLCLLVVIGVILVKKRRRSDDVDPLLP